MDSVPKHRCFQLCARKVHILDSDSESQPDASSKQLSVRESELDSGDEPDVVVVLDSAAPSGPTAEATRAGSDVTVKSPSDVDAAEIASDEQSSDGGSLARGAVDADGVAEASRGAAWRRLRGGRARVFRLGRLDRVIHQSLEPVHGYQSCVRHSCPQNWMGRGRVDLGAAASLQCTL